MLFLYASSHPHLPCLRLASFELFEHDNAVGVWVVILGSMAILYNPILPIHLTREIWSMPNVVTAVLILAHLGMLRRLVSPPTTLPRVRPDENSENRDTSSTH